MSEYFLPELLDNNPYPQDVQPQTLPKSEHYQTEEFRTIYDPLDLYC